MIEFDIYRQLASRPTKTLIYNIGKKWKNILQSMTKAAQFDTNDISKLVKLD